MERGVVLGCFIRVEVTNFVGRATYRGRLMMGQKEDELPEGSPP